MTSNRMSLLSLVGSILLDGGQSFGVRFLPQQSRRITKTLPKMHMSAVEPMVSLLLAADGAQSLRYNRAMGSVGMQRVLSADTTIDASNRTHSSSCSTRTAKSTHTNSALLELWYLNNGLLHTLAHSAGIVHEVET